LGINTTEGYKQIQMGIIKLLMDNGVHLSALCVAICVSHSIVGQGCMKQHQQKIQHCSPIQSKDWLKMS